MTSKQVSYRQLERLLDFLQSNRSLALGRVRGKEGSVMSKRLWQECSVRLNEDIQGAQKSAQEWKKYYNQYKSRTKSKIRNIKEGLRGTGGGPASTAEFTPLEERLYAILGGCSSPLPVRINPLDEITNDVEIAPDIKNYGRNSSQKDIIISDSEQYLEMPETVTIVQDEVMETANENLLSPEVIYNFQNTNAEVNLDRPPRIVKRRRRERRRESSPRDNTNFQEAGQRLAAMEQARIEVDKDLVIATNRQATALENFVEQIRRFVNVYEGNIHQSQSLRRTRLVRRRIVDSSSEEEY